VSALEHHASLVGDADADESVAGPAAARPAYPSWELLLWVLSAALVVSGAALLWNASANGSFDMGSAGASVLVDPETGRTISCERGTGPCPWALATDGLAYALALPALGSGATGLLLGIALRARRAMQQQPPRSPSPSPPPSHLQPKHDGRWTPSLEARAQPVRPLRPRSTSATPQAARSPQAGTTASLAPFMPPGQQPGDDPAHR
jgi:hypothetical protein